MAYLNSLFKHETLQTPINYVSDVRIAKAKELLDENLSISEVASRVGFSGAFYFSNCFKKTRRRVTLNISKMSYYSLNTE